MDSIEPKFEIVIRDVDAEIIAALRELCHTEETQQIQIENKNN